MTAQHAPLAVVQSDLTVARQNALDMADELRARIESGETLRFGLVEARRDGSWSTSFSAGLHKREDAAALLALALRLLGFRQDPED